MAKAKTKSRQTTKRLKDSEPVFAATLNQVGRKLHEPEVMRRPTMRQLLMRYFRWAHRCITINAQTAAAVKPCLFAIGSKRVEKCHRFKPRPLSRKMRYYLENGGYLKPGAIAQKRLQGNIDDLTEITEHPALMLLDNVNEWEEGFGFRESWYTDLQLYGRLFSAIVADRDNVPVALWRMLPHYMTVLPSVEDFIEGFEYGIGPNRRKFEPDEVLWVKLNDPISPWGGMSPTEAWLKSLDADNVIVAFQDWIFNRGGTPDVLIVSKGTMSSDQKRDFRQQWRRMFGNMARREESVALLEGETEIHDLGKTPRDMEFVKGREISRDEICNAYGVPKALVTTDDVNLANAREGSISHQRNTIWPMVMRMEDAINQRLLPRWSDRLILIHESPIQEDKTIQIQQDQADIALGYSVNEIRRRRGDEELDDPQADVPMIMNTLIPLSMAGQPQSMIGLDGLPMLGGMNGSTGMATPGTPGQAGAEPATPQGEADQTDAPDAGKAPALPPVPLSDGLELLRAYYAREIPRDAALNLARSSLRMTPEQAEAFIPALPPDAPISPEEQARQDAELEAQRARAQGTMGGNGGGNGNTPKSADARGSGAHGDRVYSRRQPDAQAFAVESWELSGRAETGLGGEAGVHSDDGHNHNRDDIAGGWSEVSQTAELFKQWNSEQTHRCNHSPDEADETSHQKCWQIHLKADKPQDDLPEPGSVRGFKKNIERTLRDQIAEILAAMSGIEAVGGSSLEAARRALEVISQPEWVERIGEASRPFLERAIDIGGNFGMERLREIQPELAIGFDVTNPEVQKFVDEYTVRLSNGVNGSTQVAARRLLGDGLEQGETIQDLSERVKDWAGEEGDVVRGTGARAENIARTESARAYVQGEQAAWKQSEVVAGKQWLLAAEACPFCEAAAKQFEGKTIALEQNFFAKGHILEAEDGSRMTLDYEHVNGPPLHPQCRCDLIPILAGE